MKELDELKKICDDQNFIINFQKDIEVLVSVIIIISIIKTKILGL